jgi:DNA-binding response OmpR family regulator
METRSILCVDPDREAQALLREILRQYEPVFASNAYDALRLLNSGFFDAYVLESWLPDFSGLALCREIHRTDPGGTVLFCTAAAHKQDRLLALQAGASAYMCKPLKPPELLSDLRVFLERAEIKSARAAVAAKRAVNKELARHGTQLCTHADAARRAALFAVERICRTRAFTAYAVKGGTRASFERGWDALFAGLSAEFVRSQVHAIE